MKHFIQILAYARNETRHAVLNILFNFIFIISGVFSLTLVMPILKFLFMPGETLNIQEEPTGLNFDAVYNRFLAWIFEFANEDKKLVLVYICSFLILSTLLKNAARYLAMINLKMLIHKSLERLKLKVFNKILKLPMSYFNHEKKGDIISRMSNDIKELEWSMSNSLEALFKEPASILIFLGLLVYMSPLLTLYVLLLLPLTAFIIGTLGKKLKAKSKESQHKQGVLLSFLEEVLGGMKIIKSFVAEKQMRNTFQKINHDTATLNISVSKRVDLASPISETLGIIISAALLWIGGNMVFNEQIAPEVFIAYLLLFSQLIPPFKQFSNAFYNVQKGIASAHRIEEIIQTEEKIYELEAPTRTNKFEHSISFKDVSFNYGGEPVLQHINLTIPKGRTVALVGHSGSGKTTLTELIPRFYDVSEGEILIDNIPIKNLKLDDLRQLIGVVNQESILFNDTIANNLKIGKEDADEEAIISALKQSNAMSFVGEKAGGIHEIIGERGGKLSGGQKQRIGIARALLKNPPILILDEATSALDAESEKFVQEALNELAKGRTTIVIAHRLSTIRDADEIVVMDKGKIVEQGDHDTLLALKGYYFKLYQMQFHAN